MNYILYTDMLADKCVKVGDVCHVAQNNTTYIKTFKGFNPLLTDNTEARFMLMHENATEPKRANDGDLGYDLTCVSVTETEKYVEYDTGVAIQYGAGLGAYIFPRSSISNKAAILANSVGVVDKGYTGSIKLRMYHATEERYNVGDKVGQLVFIPTVFPTLTKVEGFEKTTRGDGGFGSSGA